MQKMVRESIGCTLLSNVLLGRIWLLEQASNLQDIEMQPALRFSTYLSLDFLFWSICCIPSQETDV